MSTQNIYDTANQLERDFRALPAYAAIKKAFETIESDEVTKALFEEFKAKAQEFQMKQMAGEALTEEEQAALAEIQTRVTANEAINQLMAAEQQINQVLVDINAIITKPLQEVYSERQ